MACRFIVRTTKNKRRCDDFTFVKGKECHLHSRHAGLVSASCEVYDGVTRYQDVSWFGKLRLRAFPSKIERMVV